MDIDIAPVPEAPTSLDRVAAEISTLCDRVEEIAAAGVRAQNEGLVTNSGAEQRLATEVTGLFVRLRQLHRQLSEDKVAMVAAVDELKRGTDGLALELENKSREAAYIQREIASTETLETIYQSIDLIPEEEFLATAPESCREDVDTPHKLMLARLRYEVMQRDMLMEEKARVRSKRDELRIAKRKRIERLEKIDGHLQGYIKSVTLLGRSLTAGGLTSSSQEPLGDDSNIAGDDIEERKSPKTPRQSRGDTPRVGTPRV
ncbi:THO complex subunit 5 [Coemansia guatemalensis]|uniref:THO complex subunit 5 n=1 Tax=Coemansia guatemalensis TaxID=2761395 RepID=A0A9W8LV70_9FUNG|nr:THO complex subunit 5 [Coemansia guatemalensis]